METLDHQIAKAIGCGVEASARDPRATDVRLDAPRDRLILVLSSGAELSLPVTSLGLPASADLSGARVEGGGFDLYFPKIDEGVFIPDLIRAALERQAA